MFDGVKQSVIQSKLHCKMHSNHIKPQAQLVFYRPHIQMVLLCEYIETKLPLDLWDNK